MWPCYRNEMKWVIFLYLSIASVLSLSSLSCGSGVHILEFPYLIINKMKVVKFQIDISYHTKWRMKNYGRDPLWINLDKSWNVKYLNTHVTACFSTVKKRCFSFLLWYTFYYLPENNLLWFLNSVEKTKPLNADVTKQPAYFVTLILNTKQKVTRKCDSAICAWEKILGTQHNTLLLDKIMFYIPT